MTTLNFDKKASLDEILEAVKKAEGEQVSLVIDSESPVLKNHLNFRILEKMAATLGKEVKLEEVLPTGVTEAVAAKDMEDNLGFVEEGEAEEAVLEQKVGGSEETTQDDLPPQESETLQLDDPTPTHAVPLGAAPILPLEEESEPLTLATEDTVKSGLLPFALKLPKIPFKIPDLKKLNLKNKKQLLLVGGGLGALLIVIGVLWLLPSADVKLYVSSQSLDKEATITATPRLNEIDVNSASIPLTTLDSAQTGSMSTKVYGKKTIGDPAKGTVTIRNYSTANAQSLDKGTLVTVIGKSPAIQFSLDRAVTIPSGSASSSVDSSGRLVSVTDPGRLDVAVTAVNIGTDSNITNSTRLSVTNKGLDTVDAVANGDFSGGTSKQVTVVSQADRDNLLATLSAQLTDKAKSDLQGKLTSDQKLPDGGIDTQVTSKTFSKDIGQEATDLSLNLAITASGNVYSEADLGKLLGEIAQADGPKGYKVSTADTTATAQVQSINDDKTLTLLGKITGKLIPDINTGDVINNIKGKSVSVAQDYLKTLSNISDMSITLKPSFLPLLKSLPGNGKQIKIEIISK